MNNVVLTAHKRDWVRRIVNDRPLVAPIVLGVLFGVCNLAANCMTAFALNVVLPRAAWGESAARSALQLPAPFLFLYAVLFVPLLETFLAQLLPIEIIRRIGGGAAVCVLTSATLFGLGHLLNGGVAHGLTTLVGGVVLAGCYVALRPQGWAASFLATTSAHAVNNCAAIFILSPLLA